MNFLLSIIPSVIVLGILIIVHEYGHFIACRLTKVRVEKFSIGFGPEILHWQTQATRYAISLFPLGGFVKPAGESISETGEDGPKPGDYLAAPIWSRIAIVGAGVIMNYFLAFVLFIFIFMIGRPVPGTTLGGFVDGYPAKASGLMAGDRVLQVNQQPVRTWGDMTGAIEKAPEGEVELVIERREAGSETGTPLVIKLTPKSEEIKDVFGEAFKVRRLGVMPHPEASQFERFGFLESVSHAANTTTFMTVMTHKAIFYLLLGKISIKTMQGPIGIITMTGTAAKLGLPYLLQLAATLSISLAVINLLPIPALDGGHLLFLLIEAARRKRVSLQFQERATQVGFALLLTLMAVILYNDLVNIEAFEKVKAFLPFLER